MDEPLGEVTRKGTRRDSPVDERSKAMCRRKYEVDGWSFERIAKAGDLLERTVTAWAKTEGWVRGGRPPAGAMKLADPARSEEVASDMVAAQPGQQDDEPKVALRRSQGEALAMATKRRAGLAYQIDKANFLSQARVAVIPTGHGVAFVPVDIASYDPGSETYALFDGSRIEAKNTVPDYDRQAKGLQLLMRISGTDALAAADASVERVRGRKRAEQEIAQDADIGDQRTLVQVQHPGSHDKKGAG